MSHTHCTRREKAVEAASLAAHIFATSWAMDFSTAIDEADATLGELLSYADDWDTMVYTARQMVEDTDTWAASLADAE